MKRAFVFAVILLLIATVPAGAADYLRLDTDTVFMGATVDLVFYCTRQCPTPELIDGATNAFVMTATGSATWTFESYTPDPVSDSWFNWGGGLLINNHIDGTSPDSFLVGGVTSLPEGGMPIVTEQKYFTLSLNTGVGEGEICIDSAYLPPAGQWMWVDLTCGHGPDGDRPDFLDSDGNTGSPFCVFVWDTTGCPDPLIDVRPVGDALVGNHCDELAFAFGAQPGGAGIYVTGWQVLSGPGLINANGQFVAGPLATGTYPVLIEVSNNCGHTDEYQFDLVFTNNAPSFDPGTNPPPSIDAGYPYTFDFDAIDSDPCDDITFTTDGGTPTPINAPYIDPNSGLFTWETHSADAGKFFTFTIEADDNEPDKASDTYLLEIVVSGTPPPCGDVDLSGYVDIDDVVYLVSFIFGGGPPPCEPDK